MILSSLLFVIFAAIASVTCNSGEFDCITGGWSQWGTCQYEETVPGYSYDVMGVVKEIDNGRLAMEKLNRLKMKAFSEPNDRQPKSIIQGMVECVDGFAGIFPCSNVTQLSFVPVDDLGPIPGMNYRVNDMWGWTDTMDDGVTEEYAIIGLDRGTSFVRVTDPEVPEVLGYLWSTGKDSSRWRDMKVVNNHAFIVSESEGHGMQIFDLTQLRTLSSNNTRVFENTAFYDGVSDTHNIVSNPASNTVFLVGSEEPPANGEDVCDGGLLMLDVSDPINPQRVGCFGGDGYVHDAQCVTYEGPDVRYTGSEICYCYNEDSFTIVDVTDKANAVMLSRSEYEGVFYTHQGACTEDFTIALMDDELDEQAYDEDIDDARTRTYIWDVRNLTAPELMNVHMHTCTAIDHNQYVKGEYTYQSNYEAGLRVLWIDQVNYDLVEVAYFDVFPGATFTDFKGSWSNYPYYNSGAIGVTSIEYGFFMLRVDLPDEPPTPIGLQSRSRAVMEAKDKNACPALEDYKYC